MRCGIGIEKMRGGMAHCWSLDPRILRLHESIFVCSKTLNPVCMYVTVPVCVDASPFQKHAWDGTNRRSHFWEMSCGLKHATYARPYPTLKGVFWF